MLTLDFAKADEATQKYANMDGFKRILQIALVSSNNKPRSANVLAWGDGGYGKSEFVSDYIEGATGIKPFVISFHKDMNFDTLFGGIDLVAFQNGNLKYNVQNSWIAHPVVIFEEIGDATAGLLMSIKDTITRGVFTVGQHFDVQTQLIIGNTNRNPQTLMETAAIAALAERFPLKYEMTWKHLSIAARESGYKQIVDFYGGKEIDAKTRQIVYQAAAMESWSPRKTIQVVQTTISLSKLSGDKVASIAHLKDSAVIHGFDSAEAMRRIAEAELQDSIATFRGAVDKMFDSYDILIKQNVPAKMTSVKTLVDALSVITQIHRNLDKVNDYCNNARNEFGKEGDKVIDELLEKSGNMRTNVQEIMMNLHERIAFDLKSA